eukprot:364388-Chlamydomonas_euryale.AAC.19
MITCHDRLPSSRFSTPVRLRDDSVGYARVRACMCVGGRGWGSGQGGVGDNWGQGGGAVGNAEVPSSPSGDKCTCRALHRTTGGVMAPSAAHAWKRW